MDLSSLAKSMNIPLISALVLGLMAAIGPCTLATNIAALAYISRKITDRKYAVITASLYTLGRMFTYTAIGILIIAIGISTPAISKFVQEFGTWVLGPFLIVVGILLLFIDRISFGQSGNRLADMGSKVADWGMVGGFPLGVIFALAFCPYSAVLFFMVMIPMALKTAEGIMLPAMFAIGTGLPVIVFGVLLSLGVAGTAGWIEKISKAEKVVRIFVAVAFILVGIYSIIQILPIFQPSTVTSANTNPVIVNIEYTKDIFNGMETDLHCIAADSDGDPLTYVWVVENGYISGSGSRVSWMPPEELGTYPIKLTVTDSRGGETTETINIRVLTNADGTATTKVILKLKLGQSTEPVVVKNRIRSYFTTEIVCVVDNIVPGNLIYNWSAKGGKLTAEGLNEGKASRVGWTAPGVPGLCTVSVLVKDNQNNEAKGEVNFEVFCCGN